MHSITNHVLIKVPTKIAEANIYLQRIVDLVPAYEKGWNFL